mgnify:CR=1 FL=1
MYWKLLKNDISNNRLQSFNIAFFIVLSVAFLAVAAQLAIRLNTSVSTLFKKAKTPHLLQMHTGALDSKTGQEVLELFSTFHAEGRSILMVTHDVQVASRADRVLFMKDGLLVGELKPGAYKQDGIRQIQEAVNSL